MLLTYFLPNDGNGTYVLEAIATDISGNEVSLGTKTIHCDNANAVKPFGAIDTPAQGGLASGSSYINWGWALTPQPNSIPTDGSTINVYVDGVNLGHPTYNIYREDIASLFPGYANSNGAIGYFYLDTTGYDDGVHTIQWTAKDSGGNSDGIGSRYFSIQNSGSDSRSTSQSIIPHLNDPSTNGKRFPPIEMIQPDCDVTIKELEPVAIPVGKDASGFMEREGKLFPLPIGSTLDNKRGMFYWSPGPGFVGTYDFVFFNPSEKDQKMKRVKINILPLGN